MRKIILMLLLAVASSSAVAGWFKLSGVADGTVYVDPDTFRKAGDKVKMWSLVDYKAAQTQGTGVTYLSALVQDEYDCKEELTRILAIYFRELHMADGKVVLSQTTPAKWEPVPPQSVIRVKWKYACEQAEERARVGNEVAAFAADPAHPYFDEVAGEIVAFIKAGMSLAEAYERAVLENPVTRQKEIARRQKQKDSETQEKAKSQ